jgi:2-oxoglutarate/2-oxoacid ferredoxin oxidoreductase subunit beta
MMIPLRQRLEVPVEDRPLDFYQCAISRWCTGCGDHAILTAVQRLCRDEHLPPERLMFVSGIGCSSRLPHYLNAYGFHGLHGRALPVAEGIKIRRPDLHVFVVTGDGDCCSIGAAHWLHAFRYNPDLTVLVHDNATYGLTKHQTSPTTPVGVRTNTAPGGAVLEPLDPLGVAIGATNASFVAQAVDWLPEVLTQILSLAFHHRGLAFVRILQRCPEYLPGLLDPWIDDPGRIRLLRHDDALTPSPGLARSFPNQEVHDPSDLDRARQIAADRDLLPVGLLYRDASVPTYEDLNPVVRLSSERLQERIEDELDRFTIWPEGQGLGQGGGST